MDIHTKEFFTRSLQETHGKNLERRLGTKLEKLLDGILGETPKEIQK